MRFLEHGQNDDAGSLRVFKDKRARTGTLAFHICSRGDAV
jgi:hypothetical protein